MEITKNVFPMQLGLILWLCNFHLKLTATYGLTCNPTSPTLFVELLDNLERNDVISTLKSKGTPTQVNPRKIAKSKKCPTCTIIECIVKEMMVDNNDYAKIFFLLVHWVRVDPEQPH